MNWINVKKYLPGNSEAYCLMKIYLDGACNDITYRVGFYDSEWIDTFGVGFSDDLEVVAWVYILE